MDEDNLNYVEVVKPGNSSKDDDVIEEKPIMQLFRQLVIGNDNKQSTVLTNVQVMLILKDEFLLDDNKLHKLEVDIYVNVMKKFLKAWPQWDDFDRIINKLKINNDTAEIEKVLKTQYVNLKSYLTMMLDFARPLAKRKVAMFEAAVKKPTPVPSSDDNVFLEVHATRSQLNSFLYRHPHPEKNYTVFNSGQINPSRILLSRPNIHSLLNWWNIKIVLNGRDVFLSRHTVHDVQHVLVNKNLDLESEFPPSDTCFQEKSLGGVKSWAKSSLINFLNALLRDTHVASKEAVEIIVETLKADVEGLPEELFCSKTYRRYYCKYPYVRYLYTDVPEASEDSVAKKFDLQIEETIRPRYQLYFGRAFYDRWPISPSPNLIQLQCMDCTTMFSGAAMLTDLGNHIWSTHVPEPDWQCTACKKVLSMVTLSMNRWCHECDKIE